MQASSVELAYLFEAKRKRVFDAWVDPSVAKTWMPVAADAESVSAKTDPVEGGVFSYTMSVEDIGELVMHGVYNEVDDPDKLVFTLTFEPVKDFEPFPQTTVAVTFEEYDTRTQIHLDHSGLLVDMESSVVRAWGDAFKRLADRLESEHKE